MYFICFIISLEIFYVSETGSDKTTNPKDGEVKEVTSASPSVSEGTEKIKHDPKKDKKIKMVTRDKNLLLACSYFDLNHSGYIETKDAEDILLALDLNLSRAQVIIIIYINKSEPVFTISELLPIKQIFHQTK